MANLRTAMDSAFWDQPISTPQTLDATARSVPGDPFPLDGTRASKALRIQQLSLIGNGFPLGIIPSLSPTPNKELGAFSLHSCLLRLTTSNNWLGLVGQFRPKKLFTSIKKELSDADELNLAAFKDAAKHILDKSLYSLGLSLQVSPTDSSSVLLSTERHGDKNKPRHKMMLFHQLPNHDITLEAGWPELFIDRKGMYWDVPESISLDMSSLDSDSGFRYRFGIHKNNGQPKPFNATEGEAPSVLMPGLCVKAAISYEKRHDFWRVKETEDDNIIKTDKGLFWRPSYDERLNEPHSAISGVIGGTFASWFGGGSIPESAPPESPIAGNISINAKKRSPFSADLFGSICYTYQHGKFRELYRDLSRVDARLDICSATALARSVLNQTICYAFKSTSSSVDNPLSAPRLSLMLQQQVAGPIVARIDTKLSLGSTPEKEGLHVEDLRYSLSYSLRLLRSGKVVAWYSPKRKEGMIELRLFEF